MFYAYGPFPDTYDNSKISCPINQMQVKSETI